MKFRKQIIDEWHHGRFKKLCLMAVDELPICNKCFLMIQDNSFIYHCTEDNKFYHYDCFDALNHFPKTIIDGMHNDDICRIVLKPKLFQENNK